MIIVEETVLNDCIDIITITQITHQNLCSDGICLAVRRRYVFGWSLV